MRAAVYQGPLRFSVEEVPDPVPGPTEVLLRVRFCGICGSDLHLAQGHRLQRVLPLGSVLGHELSGEVVQAGPAVRGWRPGEQATVVPYLPCGECEACGEGQPQVCWAPRVSLGLGAGPGAFAELIAVDQAMLWPLPAGLGLREAALTEPLAVAHHAVERSGVRPGQSAVVLGLGPIGLLVLQVLKAAGASPIIASEISAHRRQLAVRTGANIVVDPRTEDLAGRVRSAVGRLGAHTVFECSGRPEVAVEGLALLRPSGTLVVVGLGEEPFPVSSRRVVSRELTIRGAIGYSGFFEPALRLLAGGSIDAGALISRVAPLEELEATVRTLVAGADLCKVLIAP